MRAQHPDAGQRGSGLLPAAESGEGRKGQAGAPRQAWGWAPLLLGKGAQLGLWLPWACHGPFPSTTSSQHGWHRAGPWGQPPGTPGPARCSPLLTVALSFLSSVHAVPPGTGQPGHLRGDICQRWALCPPVLLGEFPRGLGLLPGMLPSYPASRDPALFSPTVLCQWPFGMEKPNGGYFWLLH